MGPRTAVNDGRKTPRTQLVVLGGVSVVGLAVMMRLFSSGPQSAPGATVKKPPAPAAPSAAAAAPLQRSVTPVSVTWPTDVARDPFHSELVFPPAPEREPQAAIAKPPAPEPVPVDLAALAKQRVHLKATVLGDRPLAMMNGRVLRVGDVVEGFRIAEIGTNQVTLERDGSRLVITVQ